MPKPFQTFGSGHLSINAGFCKTMFERVSADDLMSLASRRHPPPLQVGAVLILEAPGGLDVGLVRTVLQQRISAVPRLRQRLQKVPLGCGRPIWIDDPGFTIDDHVTVVTPHSEADDAGLLDIAADLVTKPLPEDRPLWSATVVPWHDRRPSCFGTRHAPRRGRRVGGVGRAARARRWLSYPGDRSRATTASKPSRAGQGRPGESTFAHCGGSRKRSADYSRQSTNSVPRWPNVPNRAH